jgi:hypothetical protein
MITKDFHFTKDFRQIRGKSFVIMGEPTISGERSGHTGHARWLGAARRVP